MKKFKAVIRKKSLTKQILSLKTAVTNPLKFPTNPSKARLRLTTISNKKRPPKNKEVFLLNNRIKILTCCPTQKSTCKRGFFVLLNDRRAYKYFYKLCGGFKLIFCVFRPQKILNIFYIYFFCCSFCCSLRDIMYIVAHFMASGCKVFLRLKTTTCFWRVRHTITFV